MKRRGFTSPGFEYRKWEQSGKAYVYGTNGVESSSVEKTIDTVSEVVNEFNLPLKILNGNALMSDDTLLVENLVARHAQSSLIDCASILTELRRYWNKDVLRYGLVVLISPDRYQFKNEPSDPEPAIYGWTSNQGLSILRCFDIKNAVRHEFGHMVGLAFHHQGCAMDWSCSVQTFCENCLKDISEIWG